MKDIIALDIDGVIANTDLLIDNYLEQKFNIIVDRSKVRCYKIEEIPGISLEMVKKLLDDLYYGGLVEEVLPYSYSEHALNKLHNEGFNVVMITSRPDNLKFATLDWLNKWNLKYDYVYHIPSAEKYGVIQNLYARAFIEDRADILDSVVQKCGVLEYGLYIIDHPWNEKYDKENIIKTDNVSEAVDRIVEYRKWKNFFVERCQGDVEKFIKEYFNGK